MMKHQPRRILRGGQFYRLALCTRSTHTLPPVRRYGACPSRSRQHTQHGIPKAISASHRHDCFAPPPIRRAKCIHRQGDLVMQRNYPLSREPAGRRRQGKALAAREVCQNGTSPTTCAAVGAYHRHKAAHGRSRCGSPHSRKRWHGGRGRRISGRQKCCKDPTQIQVEDFRHYITFILHILHILHIRHVLHNRHILNIQHSILFCYVLTTFVFFSNARSATPAKTLESDLDHDMMDDSPLFQQISPASRMDGLVLTKSGRASVIHNYHKSITITDHSDLRWPWSHAPLHPWAYASLLYSAYSAYSAYSYSEFVWSGISCVRHSRSVDFGTTLCSIMALVPLSRRSCPRSFQDSDAKVNALLDCKLLGYDGFAY